MGAEILVIFLVAAAFRGLVEQTKRDMARWRARPPAARGTRWWNKPITAGAAGYWGHQAAHGFPSARAGWHDGWTRARQAHHQAQRTIAQNRAEHAEGRAELVPELHGFRDRRNKALRELERQRAERWRREQQQRDERLRREQQQRDGQQQEHGEADPPQDPPEVPGEDEHDDEKPAEGYTCSQCPVPPDGYELAGCTHQQDPAPADEPAPAATNGTAGGTMTETTYAGVKAKMAQTVVDAEQRQAEAQQAVQATEEHLTWVKAAKGEASTMADEMQALEVDPATLGAAAEHLEALDAAEKVAQDLQEQATLNKAAWDKVLETAKDVDGQLEASGHGNLDEAHANAAGGGGKKEFYGQG